MAKDYYKILGVAKSASPEEIKKAFRHLAHEHHPDKGGKGDAFKDVNEAYQILGDQKKRSQYDQFGSAAFEQGGAGPGAGPWAGGFSSQGFNINMDDMGDLGDLFGGMFGFGGRRSSGPVRGDDIAVDVTLDFKEAVFGINKRIALYRHLACSRCDGTGAQKGSDLKTCSTCGGQGRVSRVQRTILGSVQTATRCEDCHGIGKKPEKACDTCHGCGVERRQEDLDIQVPAGIDDGEQLRVSGAGEFPGAGGTAGDLYLRIHVRHHPDFKRQGQDLYSTTELPYSMLVLGGTVSIETIDGPGELKIPEATKAGTVFRLRDKGVPFMRGKGRGHHFVTVQIQVPPKMSRDQRRSVENLRDQGL